MPKMYCDHCDKETTVRKQDTCDGVKFICERCCKMVYSYARRDLYRPISKYDTSKDPQNRE